MESFTSFRLQSFASFQVYVCTSQITACHGGSKICQGIEIWLWTCLALHILETYVIETTNVQLIRQQLRSRITRSPYSVSSKLFLASVSFLLTTLEAAAHCGSIRRVSDCDLLSDHPLSSSTRGMNRIESISTRHRITGQTYSWWVLAPWFQPVQYFPCTLLTNYYASMFPNSYESSHSYDSGTFRTQFLLGDSVSPAK